MRSFLEVFDLSLRRIAYFDAALNVKETEKINAVSQLSFSLPATDKKVELCKLRYFVSVNGGDKYRIITKETDKSDTTTINFEAEHCLATLCDNVLFKDHVVGNTGTFTEDVIRYVLDHQTTQNWVLDRCDFGYEYEYGWSSENLLAALFSVTDPFTEPYIWRTNTDVYPWRLSLEKIDMSQPPQYYIMDGLNWRSSRNTEQSSTIFTRLYPLGYGEGVNQLGIAELNGGLPYLDASPEAMAEYGLIEGVWIERKYTDQAALLAAGRAMLEELSKPFYEYEVETADVYGITGSDLHRAEVGKIVKFDDGFLTIITQVVRNYDVDGDVSLHVANKVQTVATTLAELADRQRIESSYSQGATQLWGSPLMGNATESEVFTYPLWIPDETKIINKIMANIEIGPFQSYSKTTTYAGGTTQTSSAGGGSSASSVTSASGGSVSSSSQTSAAAGQTSVSGGSSSTGSSASKIGGTTYYTDYEQTGRVTSTARNGTGENHYHTFDDVQLKSHTHSVDTTHSHSIPAHTHSFSTPAIPAHTHTVTVPGAPSHTHSVTVPSHTHGIEGGIFYATERPTSAQILVNGEYAFSIERSWEGEITEYLIGEDGLIPRGRWIDIQVKPDLPAFVRCSIAAQGFIQSTGGGKY